MTETLGSLAYHHSTGKVKEGQRSRQVKEGKELVKGVKNGIEGWGDRLAGEELQAAREEGQCWLACDMTRIWLPGAEDRVF